jgi:hypothetical protein
MLRRLNSSFLALLAFALSATAPPGQAGPLGELPKPSGNPACAPVPWTPVIMFTTYAPSLFRGSDGRYNLVYDLLLANYNSHPTKLVKFEVLDDKGTVLKSLAGKELTETVTSFSGSAKDAAMPAGTLAVAWVNLSFDKADQAPKHLNHRVVYESENQLDKPQKYESEGAPVAVAQHKPVLIGPPLKGGRWVAQGGYSGVKGHRRALFAVDNALKASQRYAIDWIALNDANYSCTGDPKKCASSVGYGRPVIAVKDGIVSGVVESFLDQVPGNPVGDERFAYPGGNTIVVDLGEGEYAFYAHLKPGSIKVKEGEHVKRGQQLAELGNTGNSTGPHLHFHIQDAPGILNSHGLPYAFDSFLVTGQVSDFEQFDKNDREGKQQVIDRSPDEGTHKEELPREGTVLSFPE